MKTQIEYLGHIINQRGIQINPKEIEAIQNWEQPQTVTQVQSVIGLWNYYRRFIKSYATIAAPLTNLTKKGTKFERGKKKQMHLSHSNKC